MMDQTPDPEPGVDTDDDDDLSDLRPKTFWEKHGFKVVLTGVAVACFAAGLIFR
ncbi:MAG: hypothetical protein JWR59_743 [Brevundimonas sp.]|nr:hypothetical protein [Brevundimonas sp.]